MSTAETTTTPKPEAPRGASLLVWLDMEMSGLDPAVCRPLEIATIVTTAELEIVAEGPSLIIHQSDELLAAMDAWNTEHHGSSGLTAAVRASTVSEQDAERQTLAFLSEYLDPRVSPLCGNTISQDRRFLRRYMPALDEFFHYRSVDISTIKELVRRWYGVSAPPKQTTHRALDDIRESIEELRWYRQAVFREVPVL
ncbi:MAG TPA: oligoribonuclease [Myxococcota bacterium]|nr:oligoribonuclease [Myxococcota bacterium]